MIDIITDTLLDSVKLIPFLFLTYLAMEYIEHKTSNKTKNAIKKAGKFGPVAGGILGAFPQCGFSAAASSLYAGRVITTGTLVAIFLSTSDEMLPIFLSESVEISVIVKILLIKVLIGIAAGLVIDMFYKRESSTMKIGEVCEHEHCHCEKSLLKSAVKHTLHITLYIVAVSFVINIIISFVGEENLSAILLNRPVLGQIFAGVVGLIPNCAASVVITQLYLAGIISFGSMMSGLLVGAGVGLLILFKVNHHMKENFKIVAMLYIIGVAAGILLEYAGGIIL